MSVEMAVDGAEELASWLASLSDEVKEKTLNRMQDIVDNAVERARSEAPVRTGRLRASIGWDRIEEGYRIFAGAAYAAYQEFGTRFIPARLFMTHAWQTIMERWQELAASVTEALTA
jgi:HK97 gp10 family phage protein